MGTTFRPYSPDQELLLPPSLNEWLPEGHLAYFISDVVEELDLSAFYARYEGSGRRNSPFDPRMMLKVLIYAYATGVFSSRKIARKLEEDVALRVLAAGNFPQTPHYLRFSQATPGCVQGRIYSGGPDRPGSGIGYSRYAGD